MIPQSQITLLIVAAAIAILLPIIIAIVWIVKSKSYVYPLFIGALIFVVFALVLEGAMNTVVFSTMPFVANNTILYVIYGCLAAAFFEEGGRWVAFHYLMKNTHDKKNAVTFGIGHGGIEMIVIIGMTLLSTLMFAYSYNSLGLEGMLTGVNDAETEKLIVEMVASIDAYRVSDVVMSLLERISAMILHISCSIFVFESVRNVNLKTLGYAFVSHILMNIPAALYQRQVITNVWIVEIGVLIVALCAAYFAYQTYKKMDC